MPKKSQRFVLLGPMDVLRERGPSTGERYEFKKNVVTEVLEEDVKPLTRQWEASLLMRPEYTIEEDEPETQSPPVPLHTPANPSPGGEG